MKTQRYFVTPIMGGSGKCVVFDSKLGHNLGNGKGKTLVVESYEEGRDIVGIMSERVGA